MELNPLSIDKIDQFKSRLNDIAFVIGDRDTWDILTALRGPDADLDDDDLKARTTEVIRALVAPVTAGKYAMIGYETSKFELADKDWNNNWHFANHAFRAARALGLAPKSSLVRWVGVGLSPKEVREGR